jgi:trehalose 6-phosphate phosphatase
MQYLFSAAGEDALRAVMQRAPLLAFDFDGTLAPIVQRPEDARVPPADASLLERLAVHRPVAIVTGRRVADVQGRLGFSPRYVIGNHGAEDPDDASGSIAIDALDAIRQRIAQRLPALQAAGVNIEDKGQSLALHYRRAPDPVHAAACVDALLAGLDASLTVFGGKCVANVMPANAPDKGDAVMTLVARAGAGSAFFIGDDVNDETVFERAPPHWLTVRVGHDERVSQAQFYVRDQHEVPVLLQAMLALLDGPVPRQPGPSRSGAP